MCFLTGKKKPAPAKKAEAPAAETPAAEPPKPAEQPKKPQPQKTNKNAKKGAVKKALSAQKRVSVMLIIFSELLGIICSKAISPVPSLHEWNLILKHYEHAIRQYFHENFL